MKITKREIELLIREQLQAVMSEQALDEPLDEPTLTQNKQLLADAALYVDQLLATNGKGFIPQDAQEGMEELNSLLVNWFNRYMGH